MKKIKNNLLTKYNVIVVAIIVVLGIFIIPLIPYVNLLSMYSLGFILWLVVIIGLQFKPKLLVKAGLALLVLMLLSVLLKENVFAEQLGNATFLILSTGVVMLFKESFG